MAVVAKGVFTSPVTLSGLGQASDGQQVVATGERWLVTGNGPANGLYVSQSGAWVRAPELDESRDFVWGNDNTVVRVRGGSEWGNSEWAYNGADNPTIGLDTLYFAVRLKYYASETATELTSYIEGLGLYHVGGSTVGLTPGRAYVPGLGKVLTVASNQTKTVPGGANALYYAYLEEYPAGSGLGRLRLITTEPDEPYLGSARTQADDNTTRYLGMLKNGAGGGLMLFEMEVMGGATALVLYGTFDESTELVAYSGPFPDYFSQSTQEVVMGPSAPTAGARLVSPASRQALLYLRNTASLTCHFGYPLPPGNTPPPVSVRPGQQSARTARVGPNQEVWVAADSGGGATGTLRVLGYYESR